MKKALATIISLSFCFSAFSFEWPVADVKTSSLKTIFGQLRGDSINTSLIFNQTEIQNKEKQNGENENQETKTGIKPIEDGKIIAILLENENDTDFFTSSLGNTVIISHDDNIISVYGNLENESVPNDFALNQNITKETILGNEGNSGWQENKAGLELQLIDTNSQTAINPRTILPHIENEQIFAPAEILLENEEGKLFDLRYVKSISSGKYKVYQAKNDKNPVYKSTILINGEICTEIVFDYVFEENDSFFVHGKDKKYNEINKIKDKVLMGEINLSRGKIKLTLENSNFNGNTKASVINITAF